MTKNKTIGNILPVMALFSCQENGPDAGKVSIRDNSTKIGDISAIDKSDDFSENPKRQSDTIFIGIGCGFAGSSSPEIISFRRLDSLKDYASIKEKLFGGSDLDNLIATILLTDYSLKKETILSNSEKNQISAIKKSKKNFYLCLGCTVHINDTFENIFLPQNGEFIPVISVNDLIKESIIIYRNTR